MQFIYAKNIGFCSGVRRAYELIKNKRETFKKPVRILGELVHNSHIIKELETWGVERVNSADDIHDGTLIIAAHGCDPKLIVELREKGVSVINTTCPKVTRVIAEAQKLQREGRTVLIFGDRTHTEVVAINGAINGEGVIFSGLEEMRSALPVIKNRLLGLISQTTQNTDLFKTISETLGQEDRDITVVDTICMATYDRQREIQELAKNMDAVVVIGSPASANSQRLYQISASLNPRTYFVDSPDELKKEWFQGCGKVGVTTGASTPDYVIQKITKAINDLSI